MNFKILFIFVEGEDDEDFIKNVISPFFETTYNKIKIIQYSESSKKDVTKFINSAKFNSNSDYIYLSDFDCVSHGAKRFCIITKKLKLMETYGTLLEFEKIAIVKDEIESWYLAIANDSILENYSINISKDTEIIYKELFDEIWQNCKFKNKKDFFLEILQNYSIENGKNRNKSFEYFINKFTA